MYTQANVFATLPAQEVGGATKAAQLAAEAAAVRRPKGPYRLVTWQHVSTGTSLAVEVPLSVFSKQRGTVWAKWKQRAWRALYALGCHVGEEVWPDGCQEAAAGGKPCWDDLEEETAALAKFPFCMPQKVRKSLRLRGKGLSCARRGPSRCRLIVEEAARRQQQRPYAPALASRGVFCRALD